MNAAAEPRISQSEFNHVSGRSKWHYSRVAGLQDQRQLFSRIIAELQSIWVIKFALDFLLRATAATLLVVSPTTESLPIHSSYSFIAIAMSFELARHNMVAEQLERRGIHDPRVLEAMDWVPRHEFVPKE